MISLKLCRNTFSRLFVALALISSLVVPPGFCQETEDSQIFISGFNSYQQKDYPGAIAKMNEVLQKYPDTPLRDMALFWLARAYYKSGNQQDAARFMSQFSKEYPDNPLRGTVEEELLALTTRFERGEKLPTGEVAAKTPSRTPAQIAKAEKDRLAKEQADKEQLARKLAEQERVASAKAEEERIAAVRAEEARVAAASTAEKARLAAQKAEEERKAFQEAEQQRLAALKVEEERKAAAKVEEARKAAEIESARMAALKADQDRLAAEKAEQERMAAAKAEEERIAAVKAEESRVAAASAAEKARLAALEAEQERVAAGKAEEERIAAAEKARLAALKAEEERKAAAQAEQARVAALKAEEERLAAVRAEQERIAAEENARQTALKLEQERVAREKAEEQRLAQARAEEQRLATLKAEQERTAAEKVAKEEQAAAAAESARLSAARREQERLAAEKAAADAESARLAAVRQEEQRLASVKAEEERLARQRETDEKARLAKAALREKAIAQYQSILEKYPKSTAATTAAAKLKELGVAVALPPTVAVEPPVEQPENAQVLRLEVAQFAGFEFNLLERLPAYEVGRRISVPFEIINRGNGSDSFTLESGFPIQFNAAFAAAAAPDHSITQTPSLAPGEAFRGIVSLTIPAASIDGLRITHPVKAASRLMSEASQSRELNLIAAAPLLRAVLKADKTQPLPGEKVTYRIAVLNVGSTAGQDVSFRLNFPPQLEPVDFAATGFKSESKGALVLDGLRINSGESREYLLAFQLKEDSLAGQELLCRADLVNKQLGTSASFVSNIANVKAVHGVAVKAGSDRLSIIPGQTFTVPFVVTNTGNVREKFKLAPTVTGAQGTTIFHDLNRDNIRQATEPVITELGPLEPKEEVSIGLEIVTARSAADGSEGTIQISFAPEADPTRAGIASTRLVFSRPVLQMAMAGQEGRLKPGEVASFDLTITNNGSNLARVVELQSAWPEQLELVASDPSNSSVSGGNIVWKFKELGAGEKRSIKVSFRIKFGTSVGTNIKVTNVLKYEDQLGNRY